MSIPPPNQAEERPEAEEAHSPSGEDYMLLLDLRDRIENFLHDAVTAWLERSDLPCKGGVLVDEYDDAFIVVCYYPMQEDRFQDEPTFVTIPIGDILPEYAAHRSVLAALHG